MAANGNMSDVPTSSENDVLKNGPIVHVRADSDIDLENLFLVVKDGPGAKAPLQVPYAMRKLPASFFNPPTSGSKSPGCHSRDNSVDNTLQEVNSPSSQSSSSNVGSPQPPGIGQQNPPFHSRAHSSPATLQQTMAIAQQQQQLNRHVRQPSYDVASFSACRDNMGRLPHGWEVASTPEGQSYFMNHITKSTQWEDPRKTLRQQQQQQQPQLQAPLPPQQMQMQFQNNGQMAGAPSPQPPSSPSPLAAGMNRLIIGPLPPGWEEARNEEGKTYYINHTTRKTTWEDPRLAVQQQQQQQQQMTEARLQMLENEKRMLQVKTQRLEALKQQQLQKKAAGGSAESMQLVNQAQEMMMRHSIMDTANGVPSPSTTTAPDGSAFIAAAVISATELHNRQESSDSGVGGMGSNFNLGAIPEDSPMEMEASDLDTTLTAVSANSQGAAAASSSSSSSTGMDSSEGLLNSLPSELGEVLSPDIVQEVLQDGNKSIAWL